MNRKPGDFLSRLPGHYINDSRHRYQIIGAAGPSNISITYAGRDGTADQRPIMSLWLIGGLSDGQFRLNGRHPADHGPRNFHEDYIHAITGQDGEEWSDLATWLAEKWGTTAALSTAWRQNWLACHA